MRKRTTSSALLGLAMTLGMATATHAICDPYPPLCAQVGLYADAECFSCNLVAPYGQWATFYITASYNGGDGITGAELKVVGFPQEWYRIVVPNAAASVSLGDPLGDVGANIAFPIAHDEPCLHLYRVDIVPLTEAADIRLDVTRRTPPSNPTFECPIIFPFCVPCYTAICAASVGMTINGTGDCTVPVAKSTWGSIKQLYSSR